METSRLISSSCFNYLNIRPSVGRCSCDISAKRASRNLQDIYRVSKMILLKNASIDFDEVQIDFVLQNKTDSDEMQVLIANCNFEV